MHKISMFSFFLSFELSLLYCFGISRGIGLSVPKSICDARKWQCLIVAILFFLFINNVELSCICRIDGHSEFVWYWFENENFLLKNIFMVLWRRSFFFILLSISFLICHYEFKHKKYSKVDDRTSYTSLGRVWREFDV